MARLESASAASRFFGDRRLDSRLERTFEALAARPAGTLPRKLIRRSPLVGAYRMFNNPKVTHAQIIRAHAIRSLQRLEGFRGKVLLLHDSTVLDYSGLDVEGLGQVGDGRGQGLYGHNSLMVIPALREVVGLLGQILHRRADAPAGESRARRAARPDRESRLWKQAVAGLPPIPAGVRVIDVSDRGSDITEYLFYEIAMGRTFIVRSQHNRLLSGAAGRDSLEKLHDHLRRLPAGHTYTLRVPADEGWRETEISVAWSEVTIRPPRQPRGQHDQAPLSLIAVIAREVQPAAGQEPIEWILLTNQPIATAEQAREVVEDYACRWMIEEYHKALKTGCGIEETQMTTLHGLSNVIALTSVLGVHVLRLRCKARNERIAQQPARLHEEELKVQLAARDSKHPDWRTMTVWEFYIAVARMGGYVLNPRKRPPGWLVLWRGYIRLEDMCAGVRLMSG